MSRAVGVRQFDDMIVFEAKVYLVRSDPLSGLPGPAYYTLPGLTLVRQPATKIVIAKALLDTFGRAREVDQLARDLIRTRHSFRDEFTDATGIKSVAKKMGEGYHGVVEIDDSGFTFAPYQSSRRAYYGLMAVEGTSFTLPLNATPVQLANALAKMRRLSGEPD